MTTTYYIPPENITGDQAVLPDEEARHAVQVLRHKAGDELVCVDGIGGTHRILLTEATRKRVAGTIVESVRDLAESKIHVTLAVGILKNQKRFEIFAEKACELGVSKIIPLITERTEKATIRKDRLEKILVAAMKQCGRSRLVDVDDATRFEALIDRPDAELKLICHERAQLEETLLNHLLLTESQELNEVVIAVGPEGGFSEIEVDRATSAGFKVVSLGNRRLRAETAAITACAGVMLAIESQKIHVRG